MTQRISFDPTTRCMERDRRDIWKPYASEAHRFERDIRFGQIPDGFEEELPLDPGRYIPRKRFYDAYEALCFANFYLMTLTNVLTVNWEQSGYHTPAEIVGAYNSFMERFAKFMRHNKKPPIYITVFENVKTVGYHSHTLFHFPYGLRKRLRGWLLRSVVGSDGLPVPNDCKELRSDKDDNFDAQWNQFKYMFKCVDPRLDRAEEELHAGKTTHQLYGLTKGRPDSGTVKFQRVRISRWINRKMQAKSEFYTLNNIRDNTSDNSNRYSNAEYLDGWAKREAMRSRATETGVIERMESPL